MKILSPALFLFLASSSTGFSPFHTARCRPTKFHLVVRTNLSTSSPELSKQQHHERHLRGWGRAHKFGARPTRPFYHLSLDELRELTDYHLNSNDDSNNSLDQDVNGAFDESDDDYEEEGDSSHVKITKNKVHEISKLIASWSKLASAGYITNNHNKDGEEGENSSSDGNKGGGAVVMLTKKEKIMAAEKAEECLRYLVDNKAGSRVNVGTFMDMYHSVITAWVKSGSHSDLVHATSLLDYMESNHHELLSLDVISNSNSGNNNISTKCYVAILDGWCKSPYKDAPAQAEKILQRMKSHNLHSTKHYNNVLNRYANDCKSNSGSEAERLLLEMIDLYKQSNDITVAPNKSSFNTVIKAYAFSKSRHGSSNAKRILNMMENPSQYGLESISHLIEPDRVSCTSIMMAWANGNDYGACDVDAGIKAERMLKQMERRYQLKGYDADIKPDTATMNAVVKVWGKCGHPKAAVKSEELLNNMLKQYEEEGNVDVKPDEITFNSVIHNVATSSDVDSPQRAKNILEKMQYCHERGIIDAKPGIISYNSLLNSFAKSTAPGSAQRAQDLLDNLEKSFDEGNHGFCIEPDVYSYNTVISAWSNSNEEDGAQRAVALLDRMTDRVKKGKSNVRPDQRTYNSVLHAWSTSTDRNAPIKALGLLELMFRLYNNGDENAKPDEVSFSTVINAFSKSTFSWKARECRTLLRRMQTLYDEGQENMKPNVFVYSAVLNACAYTFGRDEEREAALNIGIETWEELKSSENTLPNHVAYGSFIRICRRLMAEDDSRRNHFITRAFKQCCADGQVGVYVLKQIRADYKLFTVLLQPYIVDGDVGINDIPAEWTRNVRERRRTYQARVNRSMSGQRL